MSIGVLQKLPSRQGENAYLINEVQLGEALSLTNGVLNVNTANAAQQDNTLPITSAAVHTEIGNIAALLAAI